ncbi:C4-dicarboxylate TRAP transporter substrate-binding protein [Neomoorella humiferrea]|uniref:C4-dicarboxylate TRAP transporter substrate-binding protein n=1 Tax=Neomoorella humiferrea TaxID=676965 RepID=UPI003D8F6553
MKKKIFIPLLLAVVILFVGACGKTDGNTQQSANQQQDGSYTLKIHMVISEQDPVYLGYAEFKKGVEARTNGKVKVELYPNGVLGSDEDLLQQAMLGGNVAVNSDAGRLGVWVPEIGILLAPYLTDSVEEMQKLVKSDLVKKWTDKLAKEKGLTVLSFNYYTGERHFVTKKPITKPEDLQGLKIRTPGSPVWQETVKAFGATPVALPWTETYPALEQGVIDGAEAQHPATYSARLYEVAKYITKTGHIQLWNCLVVGTKWFEQLPKEYQQILLEESLKAGDFTTNKLLSTAKELENNMTAAGAQISEIDKEPFKKLADAVYTKLNYQELRQEVNKVLGK